MQNRVINIKKKSGMKVNGEFRGKADMNRMETRQSRGKAIINFNRQELSWVKDLCVSDSMDEWKHDPIVEIMCQRLIFFSYIWSL